jgi:ubiquitin carboxyl-terminal hydrolase 8
MSESSTVEQLLEYTKTGTGQSRFINIGNTCYLNSALQVLMHIEELHKIFTITEQLKDTNPDYFKERDTRFYDCIKAIYKGYWEEDCIIRPIGIVRYLDNHSYFPMGEQSDSTEVLTCLVQKIHEIICVPCKVTAINPSSKLELLSVVEWNLHLESKTSQLVDMFWGQYYSLTTCQECGTRTKKFETFHYFTLQVVIDGDENPNSPISLDKLFENFRVKKTFDDDNKYQCDKCCRKVDHATNETSVWKLPRYLIIQLKRYYDSDENGMKQIKRANRVVSYPLEFDPHCILSCNNKSLYKKELKYKLHSGVFHYGNLMGGHYNCFTWNTDTNSWFGFDDDDKQDFDMPPLENNSIYQLVYKLE